MKLSIEQESVNQTAIELAERYQTVESDLIFVLQEVERLKVHRSLGLRSLFQYAVTVLKLDEAVAYALISVARKCREIPELKAAILQKKISVYKANRIVSSLNLNNAKELLEFAASHSKHEIEREIARRDPKARTPDKVKVISSEWTSLQTSVSTDTLNLLKRVEAILAQKGMSTTWEDILRNSANCFLDKHDPVRKAQRAHKRKTLCPGRVKPAHKKPENLTTLCWSHHDLIHQLEMPIDGAVTWLRSPIVAYGCA